MDDSPIITPSTQTLAEREFPSGKPISTFTGLNIALAHDWLVGYRGGEAVLEAIVRAILSRGGRISAIYTMFDARRPLAPAIDSVPHVTASLGRRPGALRLRRWLLPLFPGAVDELSVRLASDHAARPIDLVISTSSAAIKGIAPPPGVPHICYCHTPPRYLWSQEGAYGKGEGGLARRIGLKAFGASLRAWDKRTCAGVTTFLANSEFTRGNIRRFYERDAEVVHPPARTEYFTPPAPGSERRGWLYVGALEPYKNVDMAIRAAIRCGARLTVIGSGSQERALRAMTSRAGARGAMVKVLGRQSDEAVRDAMRAARVLVFPQIEDFGITAVEAQACGTPVVGCRHSGAADIIVDGKTGVLMEAPGVEALIAGAKACQGLGEVGDACRENAIRFGEWVFEERIVRLIAHGIRE